MRAAIGDMYFQLERFEDCREHFREAVHSPGGLGNPFIHLRLGQSALELGDEARAADELARAFMGGGEELFEGDDAKYLEFIQSRLQPPRGRLRAPGTRAPGSPLDLAPHGRGACTP